MTSPQGPASHEGAHRAHCNQGEHIGGCKYGPDEYCPVMQKLAAPQGPAREERWFGDEERLTDGVVTYRVYHPDDLNLADYLNALEAERDRYRQALEKVNDVLAEEKGPIVSGVVLDQIEGYVGEALALSSAGRDMQSRLPKIQPRSAESPPCRPHPDRTDASPYG